jgi:hypothetical protein
MNNKEEKLLREFVRKTFVKKVLQEQKEAMLQEQQVRTYVRSLINEVTEEKNNTVIFEGKDQAKPHPSTAINFLRDAFRKLVPNLEKDYKLLTTSEEQRESFKNHYLAAMIRMFDQADGLSASVEAEDYDDIKGDIEQKASEEGGTSIDDLALEEDLELDRALEEVDVNIVDELRPEEEPEEKQGLEGEIDKEITNKDKVMNDREKFGAGVVGDLTGRNKAYDSFKNTKSYPLSYYQDLSNQADKEEYKKWAIYNLNLLFKGFEQDLKANPDLPNISDPQQQI